MSESELSTSGAGQGALPTAAPVQATLWDNWDTPPRIPGIPVLHLEGFDGPMDLLLDLAERQRIDFGRMSILALAEQFVAALRRLASSVSLEKRADWVVVATRLVLLRSRLVFPKDTRGGGRGRARGTPNAARPGRASRPPDAWRPGCRSGRNWGWTCSRVERRRSERSRAATSP